MTSAKETPMRHGQERPCTWYEGDPFEDVPDDYNGPCIHCHQSRDAHAERTGGAA